MKQTRVTRSSGARPGELREILKSMVDFACQRGFHELGFDPLSGFEKAMRSTLPAEATDLADEMPPTRPGAADVRALAQWAVRVQGWLRSCAAAPSEAGEHPDKLSLRDLAERASDWSIMNDDRLYGLVGEDWEKTPLYLRDLVDLAIASNPAAAVNEELLAASESALEKIKRDTERAFARGRDRSSCRQATRRYRGGYRSGAWGAGSSGRATYLLNGQPMNEMAPAASPKEFDLQHTRSGQS
jgi:hypothetical protein